MTSQEFEDQQEEEILDWEGGEDLDEEFRNGDCIAIEMGSEDGDRPEDMSDDGCEERGFLSEDSDEERMEPTEDDAVARTEHKEAVLSVAVCPGLPELVATGGQDDTAVLWDLKWQDGALQYEQRKRLEGHTDSVTQVAFSTDGQYLATASYDATVKVWQAKTGELAQTLEGPAKEVEWLIWHPKGHALLAGSNDTMAWMWWAPTGKLMQIFAGHGASVTCGCWALGGKLIATGSEDSGVIVWNPRGGTAQQNFKSLFQAPVLSICAHPDAPIVVAGSEDSTVKVLQIETGAVLASLGGHLDGVEAVAFNQPSPGALLLLATASMDGKVQIFDAKTFQLRVTLTEHVSRGGVTRFKWLPPNAHGSFLTTAGADGTLRLFNALSGTCVKTLQGHSEPVVDLDVVLGPEESKGQLCVFSASEDNTSRAFLASLTEQTVDAVAAPKIAQQPEAVEA